MCTWEVKRTLSRFKSRDPFGQRHESRSVAMVKGPVSTAISRKFVAKNAHATKPKGNMGYDQYTVPETVAVEPTFVAFL